MNSSYSALENRLEAGENSIKANAEKLINMNKIKSDIDLIKYTLNSASPSSVRAVANGKSVIPSDALDSLRNLIDNVNSDVNQLEVKKKEKCPLWGSNSRPSDYETDALTNCAKKADGRGAFRYIDSAHISCGFLSDGVLGTQMASYRVF